MQCASKILGEREPELVYNDYDRDEWEKKLEEQLTNSGLPHVILELVDRARKNALTSEMTEAIRLVRELRKKAGYVCYTSLVLTELMSVYLRQKLLEARRTEAEFEEAKNAYNKTSQKIQVILNTWDLREQEQIDKNRKQLQNACAFVSRKADVFVQPALEKVLQCWCLVDRTSDNDSTISMPRTPPGAEFTNQVGIYFLFSGSESLNGSLVDLESDLRGRCKRVSSFEPGRTSHPTWHAQGGACRFCSTSWARSEVI